MRQAKAERRDPHDHAVCVHRAVATATAVCRNRGLNLTPSRRRVLEIVWRAHAPIGAYEILAELAKERDKAAPPTVYRALEFLVDAGLVHRIDTLNAYVGCESPEVEHLGQFLVCRRCQRVIELDDPAISSALLHRSRALGFDAPSLAVEIKGVCRDCNPK
jgi:Fur family zinc uptake transcriptional regulator